jgi:hypothetical protein
MLRVVLSRFAAGVGLGGAGGDTWDDGHAQVAGDVGEDAASQESSPCACWLVQRAVQDTLDSSRGVLVGPSPTREGLPSTE